MTVAPSPIYLNDFGKTLIVVKSQQYWKAYLPILVNLSDAMATVVKWEQYSNARSSIRITLCPIVIEVRDEQL